ncbi:MAG: SGNH/GDSL hydrolase family protein [Muribaculaceae bacterium]
MKKFLISIISIIAMCATLSAQDWPNLNRFRDANSKLPPPTATENRVVFLGNSIFEQWNIVQHEFWTSSRICRGISGQTTGQMLIRVKQDVVDLQPKIVVILGGTNDIAGNQGPASLKMIQDNLSSIAEVATANNIKVIMCAVLPTSQYWWAPNVKPKTSIVMLNQWIEGYARSKGYGFVDYYSPLVDENQGLKASYMGIRVDGTGLPDTVHPNKNGYLVMGPPTEAAINKILNESGVSTAKTAPKTVVYPNPVVDGVAYALVENDEQSPVSVKIHSSDGRLVRTKALGVVSGSVQLPIEELLPGMYLINIVCGNRIDTAKITIK